MQGVISSVSLDLAKSKMMYDVSHREKVIGHALEETELAYAFQCPVIVQQSEDEKDGEAYDAVVLQARRVEGSMIYTVMHGVGGGYNSYKVGITGDRVKYRLDKVAADSAVDEKAPAVADQKSAPAVLHAVEQAEPPVPEVSYASAAASFDCDSKVTHDSKTHETSQVLQGAARGFNNLEPSPGLSMESPTETHTAKRAKLSDGNVEKKHPSFEIVLPTWLQKDKEMKDRLYGELLFCLVLMQNHYLLRLVSKIICLLFTSSSLWPKR